MKECIIELIQHMKDVELFRLYKEYSLINNTDTIYNMDDFENILENKDGYTIAHMIYDGNFNPYDEYFKIDDNGNLESIADYELKDYICIGDIADFIINKQDNLYNDDIESILEEVR